VYNFIVPVVDTDSTSYCKPDMSPFSKEEIDSLIKELNSISPEFMIWENDGVYDTCLVIRAKNYILKEYGTGKLTIKGSAFKDQKKEPILQEFMKEISYSIIEDGINYMNLTAIYDKYAQQVIQGVQDIKPWCSKKTVTEKILDCNGWKSEVRKVQNKKGKTVDKVFYFTNKRDDLRLNEIKIWEAIKDIKSQEGDKVYLYPVQLDPIIESGRISKHGRPLKDKVTPNNGLRLAQEWKPGDEDRIKLLERIHSTVLILKTVLDMANFKNYALDFDSKLE
jgi:hypothetical protein